MNEKLARTLALSLGIIAVAMTLVTVVLLPLVYGLPHETNVSALVNDLTSLLLANITFWLGVFLVSLRPHHRISWIVLGIGFFNLLSIASLQYSICAMVTQPGTLPGGIWATWVNQWAWTFIFALLTLLLLLFPTGYLPSSRWRWFLYASLTGFAGLFCWSAFSTPLAVNGTNVTATNPLGIFSISPQDTLVIFIATIVVIAALVGGVAALFLRFRSAHGEERAQLKWFTYTAVLAICIYAIGATPLLGSWSGSVSNLAFVLLPLAIVISILKYRLYDIDIIIRKTLTYLVVTSVLGIVFLICIIGLQQLFAALTGSGQNEIVTVLSTLVIAAMFVPLRYRIQSAVDKRFYRKKYDAQKVLHDFAMTVRDETDLEKLTGELLNVVNETMQPKKASVWLKNAERKK